MAEDNDQLLVSVFRAGVGYFGIPAAQIQEVVQVGTITRVHHAPAYVRGIRNLRGRIVSVIDVRAKLNLGEVEIGPEARIMILELAGELVGLLVDEVDETIFLDPSKVSAVPEFEAVAAGAVRGVYEADGHLLALLDQHVVFDNASVNTAGA